MAFEVEQKFLVSGDTQTLRDRISKLGAKCTESILQQDLYFNHPARDFALTDEALRIRAIGDRNYVTYKGSRLETKVKTRQEIEIPLGDGIRTSEEFGKMLQELGFRPVRPIRKQRTTWTLMWENRDWELSWDEVEGLGTFLEIESIASETTDILEIQDSLLRLADHLQLSCPERKSYLEMILEKYPSKPFLD